MGLFFPLFGVGVLLLNLIRRHQRGLMQRLLLSDGQFDQVGLGLQLCVGGVQDQRRRRLALEGLRLDRLGRRGRNHVHVGAEELLLGVLVILLGLDVCLKLIDLVHLVFHLVVHELQILDSLLILHGGKHRVHFLKLILVHLAQLIELRRLRGLVFRTGFLIADFRGLLLLFGGGVGAFLVII